MKKLSILLLLFSLANNIFTEEINFNENFGINLQYEKGFLKFFHHTIQVGKSGTNFNYIDQGGQEILFPFERFSADIFLFKNNKLSFLYQPLTLETTVKYYADVIMDNVTFPSDTIVDMKYGFPFYRLTYSYQFHLLPSLEIGAGLALQLRNASITFKAADGEIFTSSQNVGPVPALHLNCLYSTMTGLYVYFEATGLYAASALINGATFDFEGSILDSSIRLGAPFHKNAGVFLNIRFLGGSARGVSEYPRDRWSESRESFGSNYLALGSLTLGLELDF